MKLRLVSTLVLVLGIAALASASAFAGNGNGQGNGKGNGKDDSATAPAATVADATQGHGNSASAPGQVRKDEAPAPVAVAADAASTSTEQGVKPANDTGHDTHAAASSDDTKLYGSGKTAGQVAQRNGAAPSTVLHGPGNSQPHKASPCAGGHEVDVHALKGTRVGSCGNASPPPHSTPDPVKDPDPVKSPGPAKSPDPVKGPTSDPVATPGGTVVVSGSVSVTKVIPKHRGGGVASGILGASGALGRDTLPFTGVDLWSTVFVAVALMLIGLALCQRARSLPVRESEREARP
jgi:hypothetical protein